MKRLTGRPDLSTTLSTATNVISGSGSRNGVSKVLVIMMDTKSSSSLLDVQKYAKSIAFNGVKVMGVALGSDAALKIELASVVTNENNLIYVSSQTDVKTIAGQLSWKVVYSK